MKDEKRGKVIAGKGKYVITEASPDDPIYNRGFVFGGMRTKDSSRNTAGTNSQPRNQESSIRDRKLEQLPEELREHLTKGLPEEFKDQNSG
jgi:hypothetical protein